MSSIPNYQDLLNHTEIKSLLQNWIHDDIPSFFDVGGLVVGKDEKSATLWMKSNGVLAGKIFFELCFELLGCQVVWEDCAVEGQKVDVSASGKIKLATVNGPVNAILRGERTALNTLSRCSGVATLSAEAVALARECGWNGMVAGTRKTTPGFRLVEKYGLLVGGAATHRLDLSQMCMLKDNHIWAAGSITNAVKLARKACGFSSKIEVECQSLEEALEAAEAGADVVMLDNFTPARLKTDAQTFKQKFPHVTVEASGGITTKTMKDYLCDHVDVVSQGKLTQGYSCLDYSLKIDH
uniref:Nicotinate-nucleotide pyrophosphorylase [carboxylating] n=1 Tax=Ditylum brightwellii TaxID=49249 RepID=A0A7S4SX58_9STRA|mmetsp:Transcript_27202/g.36437  ORF Transcript_27202/g.36437 Transcript_27202/m.36437 type:complete len:296 (+) Transcript_27202:97-984(+)